MISVVIPVYNAEKYLRRCVDSILVSRSKSFEIILVDDGSTDSSAKICDEYAEIDERIKAYHKENGGASSARNNGIDLASGDYIIFIDADDEISPYAIDKVQDAMLQNADIIFFGYRMIYKDKEEDFTPGLGLVEHSQFDKVITQCEIYTPWGKALRRELIERHDINFDIELTNGEDTLFIFQFLNVCKRAYLIDDVLYLHYVLSDSLSSKEVPYHLNLRLLNQLANLTESVSERFNLNTESQNKLMELRCVCISRILQMNIPKGQLRRHKSLISNLDMALYYEYSHPKTLRGRIFNWMLKHKMYALIDILSKLGKK